MGADEMVTGLGRLGAMFGRDHYGLGADIITIAKGLTSAYAPLSESIIREKAWKILVQGRVIAWAMPPGDILGTAPPFCLTREDVDGVVSAMAKAVKTVLE
ncbi:MAG: adenosylmethionine-8-amino-7-oxononanoate aminotransferase [Ascidiaceihabitans sp.]|jgi:adenosylmethionine-8-amino-7-oxononanoate aminotransferase